MSPPLTHRPFYPRPCPCVDLDACATSPPTCGCSGCESVYARERRVAVSGRLHTSDGERDLGRRMDRALESYDSLQ